MPTYIFLAEACFMNTYGTITGFVPLKVWLCFFRKY